MNRHYHEVANELREPTRDLRNMIPEAWQGFVALHRGAMAEGEISAKHKELMALAVSVVTQCDGCIGSHARGAVRHGATRQEAAEAIGVAMLMAGGPATVYGPRALAAFDEFAAAKLAAVK